MKVRMSLHLLSSKIGCCIPDEINSFFYVLPFWFSIPSLIDAVQLSLLPTVQYPTTTETQHCLWSLETRVFRQQITFGNLEMAINKLQPHMLRLITVIPYREFILLYLLRQTAFVTTHGQQQLKCYLQWKSYPRISLHQTVTMRMIFILWMFVTASILKQLS